MAIAALALIGVPMSSGAYARGLGLATVYEYAREIMTIRHERAAMWLFYVPALTTFITAFYMARAWWLTFGGRSRNEDLAEGAHESFLMVLPVGILAAMSFNFYEVFLLPRLVEKSLLGAGRPGGSGWNVIRPLEESRLILQTRSGAYAAWGFLGALPALLLYRGGLGLADRLRRLPVMNLLHAWLREGMFFDALYHGIVLRATLIAAWLAGFVDRFVLDAAARTGILVVRAVSSTTANIDEHFVDGAATGIGQAVRWGGWLAVMPRGRRLRVYLMAMVGGVTLLAVVLWTLMKWSF
jgi:NADH-quinone oxidoreductase subunit L